MGYESLSAHDDCIIGAQCVVLLKIINIFHKYLFGKTNKVEVMFYQ